MARYGRHSFENENVSIGIISVCVISIDCALTAIVRIPDSDSIEQVTPRCIHREDPGMERDQFATTFSTGADADPAIVVTRKRIPSAVTSYSDALLAGDGARCESNSGCGASASKERVAPYMAFTAAATIFPSAPAKNSSLPSPRQRGCSPPAMEIFHRPSPAGNGCTYTSRRPDSSVVKAIQWPSGESCPKSSLNPERRKGTGFRSAPPSIGSTQMSYLVFGSNSE